LFAHEESSPQLSINNTHKLRKRKLREIDKSKKIMAEVDGNFNVENPSS